MQYMSCVEFMSMMMYLILKFDLVFTYISFVKWENIQIFLLQKLSKLVENITCYTFSQLHTFQPIWLGLEVVDKGENKASVLDVLSRHTAELCSATSLKRTLCWASFLFNNFNQIHQQGKKCERRWEKWVCIEELKNLILGIESTWMSVQC